MSRKMNLPTKWEKADSCSYHKNPACQEKFLASGAFAIKTRQQELIEIFEQLDEDKKRLAIRREMIEHNKQLVAAAKDAGVKTNQDYAIYLSPLYLLLIHFYR